MTDLTTEDTSVELIRLVAVNNGAPYEAAFVSDLIFALQGLKPCSHDGTSLITESVWEKFVVRTLLSAAVNGGATIGTQTGRMYIAAIYAQGGKIERFWIRTLEE